ncbi:MAG: sigma-70 family RNA polymerase sigma factor [Fuerstiella sp.]
MKSASTTRERNRSLATSDKDRVAVTPRLEDAKSEKIDRVQQMLKHEVSFIYCAEFDEPDAAKRIADPRLAASTMSAGRLKTPGDVPPHLAHLWKIALLKPEQEYQLFRRMNFLKFRANSGRCRLNPDRPNVRVMDRIEKDLEDSRQIRDHIIQANLRLVVSIARRFVTDVTSLDELISDGNLILMKAVDRFDYSRGFRFSTYATHAVQREFYRNYKNGRRRRITEIATDPAILFGSVVASDDQQQRNDMEVVERLKKLMQDTLSPREQNILDLRLGLNADDGGQTLREVGEKLNISKERVRQLQTRAIEQVRELALHAPGDHRPPSNLL